MKLIESKAEYIPQEEGLEGIYKAIELAGRTAYHSQDKITPTSAKNFVDRMIKSKHGACLEHGTVYLKLPFSNLSVGATNTPKEKAQKLLNKYIDNKYTQVFAPDFYGDWLYATSNMRVLVENNWLDDLKYLCSHTEFHEKRYTMRFTCSRAIANELIRHRTMSFLQESTRYINYCKERHGGELTLIIPDRSAWERTETSMGYAYWDMLRLLDDIELVYMEAIKEGVKPEIARDILPNITKTELIMTGFSSDWRHVLDLRLFEKTGKVAPDMLDLMQKAQKTMQEAGIWEDIMSKPSKFE
jgi:thymidylate synthase (FAD)